MLMAGVSHGSKGSTSACEGVADGQQHGQCRTAAVTCQHHAHGSVSSTASQYLVARQHVML